MNLPAAEDSLVQTLHPKPRRILIECTPTYLRGGNTGIQRVTRNIVNNCRAVGEKSGVECQPVIWTGRRFAAVNCVRVNATLPVRTYFFFKSFLRPYKKHLAWLRRGQAGSPDAGDSLKTLARRTGGTLIGGLYARRNPTVEPRPGDVLFYPDSSWTFPPWAGMAAARRNGAAVGVLFYDIIALNSPQLFDAELAATFARWAAAVVDATDFYLTISSTVHQELQQYLASRPPAVRPRHYPGAAFRLGSELDSTMAAKKPHPALARLFAPGKSVYLNVATIEPRKNQAFLLDAFDRLWGNGEDLSLCIMGGRGWLYEPLIKRIVTHPRWQKNLFLFHDASDTDLAFAYGHARAIIAASLAEGLGLSILEALARQCLVLASDIPAHREAGGAACAYFSLHSPDALVELVQTCQRRGRPPGLMPAADSHWPNWQESCRELIAQIRQIAPIMAPPG